MTAAGKPLAAFGLLEKAQSYLPGDPAIKQLADQNTLVGSITSSPAAATIAMQDYATPEGPWRVLGNTPLSGITVPKGFFRWKISSLAAGEVVEGLPSRKSMNFALDAQRAAPAGMVPVPADTWTEMIDFIGFVGPYKIPPFYLDRLEVTNRDYQKFVDSGGYAKKEYWTEKFVRDGREIPWAEAVAAFHDTTNRPGPAGWVAGHYGEGTGGSPRLRRELV